MIKLDDIWNREPIWESDNLVVIDIVADLPKHKKKTYGNKVLPIRRVVYHHTAGNTTAFPRGLWRTAEFIRRAKILGGRDWPGMPYNLYVPNTPVLWEPDRAWGEGRWVIFCCQYEFVWSYHTKGANHDGFSVAFQGNFNRRREPSPYQKVVASLLWDEILKPQFLLRDSDLYTHSDYGKAACPGPWLDKQVHGISGRKGV